MAADFTTGVCVVAVELPSIGVGSAGRIRFMGIFLVGRHRLGDYPHLLPSLHWCSGSSFLLHLLGH